MRFFFIFFILTGFIFAETIKFEDSYLIDKTNTININNILQKKQNFKKIDTNSLGFFKDTVWIKLNLKNTTSKTIKKRVFNKKPSIDYIDVYIVKNTQVIKTYLLGDRRDHKIRDNLSRFSYFDLNLKAFEKIEVFIKQKTTPPMDIKWDISDIDNFNKNYKIENIIYFIAFGMLSLATIISLSFFIFLRNSFYLVYAIFTICSITYQFMIAGFFYELNIHSYLDGISSYVIVSIATIFLALFPISFFSLKKNEYKILVYILKALILFFIILIILHFTKILENENIYGITAANLITLTLLILSIRIYLDKKAEAFFYLLANISVFSIGTYFILGFSGVFSSDTIFYKYSLVINAILQDFLLGLAIVHATYLIKKNSDKKTELLNEYSKLSFIGQTMVNISHQWKTPINNIYNSINHIEAAQEFKDKNIEAIIDKNINNIKQNTIYLKQTALNQLNFYKEKKNIEKIIVYDEINYVIKLIESEFSKKDIDIKLDCDKNLNIQIEKNYFLNILMIFLENSFKIFEKRDIKKPFISIKAKKQENKFILSFEDNGEGISNELIDKIFDKDYSLLGSTGVGLYLAKEIITHKLKGEISVQNIKNGILFEIII